jgi:hypothetical protein
MAGQVPEHETNLLLVYVYGDVIDVNRVYRLSPQQKSLPLDGAK